MARYRWLALVVALLLVALLLVACGVEASPRSPIAPIEGTDRTVEVSVREFEFSPSVFAFERGETIGFRVTNEGAVRHEFRMTTNESVTELIASAEEDEEDEDRTKPDGIAREGEILIELQPGETQELVVSFDDPTKYEVLVCVIPGHYEAGMKAELVVND